MKKNLNLLILAFLLILIFSSLLTAQIETEEKIGISFTDPVLYTKITAGFLIIFVIYMLTFGKELVRKHKNAHFLIIALPVIVISLWLVSHTIYENAISETKGNVHWHADYQVWACEKKLDLIDPRNLLNRVGSSVFHEHGDDRVHIEGIVFRLEDVRLEKYFEIIGGKLGDSIIVYPTNEGIVSYKNGDKCNGEQGMLKVYVNGKQIQDVEDYIISPETHVPPGDCIIFDFSPGISETTNKICDT